MKSPKLFSSNNVVKRMKMAEPIADTPLAIRMLEAFGQNDYQVLKTFQQHFGAKLVHYQDKAGEVGKRPGWAQ